MESIREQIEGLEKLLHELTHPAKNTWYVDMEEMIRLNREIRTYVEKLYPVEAKSAREEALLCCVLLQAYAVMTYSQDIDEEHRQHLLVRSCHVLRELPISALRCRLLVYCYGEVGEEALAKEAHAIINSWTADKLSDEEKDLIATLHILEASHP